MNGDETVGDHVPVTTLVTESVDRVPREKCNARGQEVNFIIDVSWQLGQVWE